MFKNVARRDLHEARPAPAREDDDDDAISLASTISDTHDPDQEFEVENILAEESNDGNMYYLVEWEGFPLSECTWEPESNLGPELRGMWEEMKERQERGEELPFDIRQYHEAVRQKAQGKAERHRRRNVKRVRLGLQPTKPWVDEDGSDEAEEVSYAEAKHAEYAPSGSRNAPKAKTGSVPKPPKQPQRRGSSDRRHSSEGNTSRDSSVALPGTAKPKAGRTSSSSSSRAERPSLTGYQGTARKISSSGKATTSTVVSSPDAPGTGITGPANAAAVARGSVPGRTLQSASRHTLKAKKSATAKGPGRSNVFSGGAAPKAARSKLVDAMADSGKEQKLFQKYRYRWLAEKGTRDRENDAPDFRAFSGSLFEISKGPMDKKHSAESSSMQEGQNPGPQGNTRRPKSTTDIPLPSASSLSKGDGQQQKKKRKSVRFLTEEDGPLFVEPTEMGIVEIGSRAAAHDGIAQRAETAPLLRYPPLKLVSVDKSLKLGTASRAVDVTMHGIPSEVDGSSWVTQFLAQTTLDCSHSCFAKSLAKQMDYISQSVLCAGTIESKNHPGVLEAVAGHLRAGILGLYSSHPEYSLIVYPPRCDEWKWLAGSLLPESGPTSQGALKYLIFSSTLNCGPFLRPGGAAQTGSTLTGGDGSAPESDRETLVRRLLGLDYSQLLPAGLAGRDATHNFFLAFPLSKGGLLPVLYHWLRACNPDCRIFTSHHAGGWSAFRSAVAEVPGVVLIHELVSWSLHRFPSLHHYLNSNSDAYWCFSEASHPRPIFPSSTLPEETVAPGQIDTIPLFPDGYAAILVTPSFLTSEPQRTLEFLGWVLAQWKRGQRVKLLSAWNLGGYLEELAEEKWLAREELLRHPLSVPQKEIQANLRGLSQLDCENRISAVEVAAELHKLRAAIPDSPFLLSEEASPLVYADPSIDANDEQSLVNWFGWWSTLRMDQFRGFHIVGSSEAMTYKGSSKGERLVRIPTYSRFTINDPDAVMDAVRQAEAPAWEARDARAKAAAEGEVPAPAPAEAAEIVEEAVNTVGGGAGVPATAPKQPRAFHSQHLSRESWDTFYQHLRSIIRVSPIRHFWRLFMYPISWTDSQMAQHFHDTHEDFRTMRTWFDFAWSFSRPPPKPDKARLFNTYIGLFYTITDEWDPANPPSDRRPRRHPWIAVYRPVNPHHPKKRRQCELLIWDCAARERFSEADAAAAATGDKPPPPREDDLIFAQRHLIQMVREQGPVKNPDTWLDRVWLGGFDSPARPDSASPIDTTLDHLGYTLGDIQKYLPGPETGLPKIGYRRLVLSNEAAADGEAAPDRMDLDHQTRKGGDHHDDSYEYGADGDEDDDGDDDEDSRIIFHPPRGRRKGLPHDWDGQSTPTLPMPPPPPTRCVNRLYEESRLAVARGRQTGSKIKYEFQHTLEWYAEQEAEGRGYQHINVASWEVIFNTFRISSADGSTGDESGRVDNAPLPGPEHADPMDVDSGCASS